MIGLAVFVALVAVLAAVAMFLQSRSAREVASRRATELEELRHEMGIASADLTASRSEAKERREEASALRADLAATKKKAFEQTEALKKAGGAVALRAEIDKLSTRLAEARAEVEQKTERLRSMELALEKQAKEMERLRVAAVRAPTPPVAVAPPPRPPSDDPSKLEAEKGRADKAEARLAEQRKRMAELEKDLKAARGRLETEKRIYIVQKGELELAGDRNAELRRRYETLRKEHEELLDAVRQAADEERRLAKGKGTEETEEKPAHGTA
ncbi:MAG TPA: hypothetical protein VMK12_20615 [Anaeromyxobacteraceae bacterium]|nr:hypothetical protein [Anaeromyxobacteraceae bacterium]